MFKTLDLTETFGIIATYHYISQSPYNRFSVSSPTKLLWEAIDTFNTFFFNSEMAKTRTKVDLQFSCITITTKKYLISQKKI